MIQFRSAVREQTSVMIGLAGPSSCGKTYSALRLATGLAGGRKIFMIDTESRRGLHYADEFKFEYGELQAPFRPGAYLDAMESAKKAGAAVIIVDSMSHEHEGSGGILDWHEEELKRMAGDDWAKRERAKFTAWIKPKGEHNRFLNSTLQLGVHLIFCFRAKEKLKLLKNSQGKIEPVPQGWQPICADRFEYEMLALLMMPPNSKGKIDLSQEATKLQGQHAGLFPDGEQINETMGANIAAWARGKGTESTTVSQTNTSSTAKPTKAAEPKAEGLILRGEPGTENRVLKTAGMWLDAFQRCLEAEITPDVAQRLWEDNEDTFHRISAQAAKKNSEIAGYCAVVGRLALEKRTKADETVEQDAGSQEGPNKALPQIDIPKAAREILSKIVKAGSPQMLTAIEHDYVRELAAIKAGDPAKHAELMEAFEGKRNKGGQ
jgi:AAA domain